MSELAASRISRTILSCDGASVPQAWQEAGWPVVPIRSRGERRELNLRADGLGPKMTGQLDRRANDLTRIASYAFAADQLISRGGKGDPHRQRWRRELALCVPVAGPDFWSTPEAVRSLTETLQFATEDSWNFAFAPAGVAEEQLPLDLNVDDREQFAGPDCVALLSGGIDSLCAAVEAVAEDGRRPLLVSHRTAPHVAGPQRALRRALRTRFSAWAFPEVSFWVHQRGKEAVERTRRTRGFLVAALGAAVAGQVGLPHVLVPDNGYVSINPPVNAQLVGALNSRATHPTFLRLINHLLALVFPDGVRIENPLADRTRAEALQILAGHGCADLLPETRSCAKSRRSAEQPHCGTCSQCVDRRVATVAAGLEKYDPADRYGLDLFTAPLPPGEARVFAASYVGFAQRVAAQGAEELFLEYPQLEQCLDLDGSEVAAPASQLTNLLARHAEEVVRAIGLMVQQHSDAIARRRLPATCLLQMVTGSAIPNLASSTPPGDGMTATEMVITASQAAIDQAATASLPLGPDVPMERPRFEHHSRVWFVQFGEEKAMIDHSAGMSRLARLLKAPGQEWLAQDLRAWSSPGKRGQRAPEENEGMSDGGLRGSGLVDPIIDEKGLARFQEEAKRLKKDLAEADAVSDEARKVAIRADLEKISDAIAASKRKGGLHRETADLHEKARQAVSHSFAKALNEIGKKMPVLRVHLDESLHLGLRCTSIPGPVKRGTSNSDPFLNDVKRKFTAVSSIFTAVNCHAVPVIFQFTPLH